MKTNDIYIAMYAAYMIKQEESPKFLVDYNAYSEGFATKEAAVEFAMKEISRKPFLSPEDLKLAKHRLFFTDWATIKHEGRHYGWRIKKITL